MNDLLTKAIVRLLDRERFYAEIILQMDITLTTSIKTAGVYITDKVHMHINPEFFSKLSTDEQTAILIHECKHILFDHIPRSKELAPDVYAKNADRTIEDSVINHMKHSALNVAADCSINPNTAHIPVWGVFPKNFDLEDGQTFEWYHDKLKDNEKMKAFSGDDHALWGESEQDKELLREKIRQTINSAAKKAKAAGSMSASDELLVDRLNHKPKDWKADLRRFVAKQIETILESSRKKRNRRYGISHPGVVKWEKLTLGVAIDTSGSVSDEALSQFMAEIAQIHKYANVIVVEADSEIKNRYEFDPKKKYSISGRGGTAYTPALDHFTNKETIDGLIYFGDMDCFDEIVKKPKYPVLWAIVGNQNPPVSWGSRTKIEINKK